MKKIVRFKLFWFFCYFLLPKNHVKLQGGFEFSEMHSIDVDIFVVSLIEELSSLLFGVILTSVGLT